MGVHLAAIETLRHPAWPRLLHVRLHGDDGGTGLGETFGAAATVECYLHEVLAPRLLGLDLEPATLHDVAVRGLYGARRGPGAAGVESQAVSAIDGAAWDATARAHGTGLAAALGAPHGGTVARYATCLDPDHGWGLGGPAASFRDHERSQVDGAALAVELAAAGYAAMKVWPFAPGGDHGAARRAVATAVEAGALPVAVDLYGGFDAVAGEALARDLDELGLAWIEDPLPADALGLLPALRGRLRTPVCAGEHLALGGHDALLATDAVDLLHVDLGWAGGPSEGLRVGRLAAAAGVRLALHDCSGPVTDALSTALAAALGGAALVEEARAYAAGPYPAIARAVPDAAGHGLELVADPARVSRTSRTAPRRSRSPRTA